MFQSEKLAVILSRFGNWIRLLRRWTISFGGRNRLQGPRQVRFKELDVRFRVLSLLAFCHAYLFYSAGYSTRPTVPTPKLMAREIESSVNSILLKLKFFFASSSNALPDSMSRA